MYGVRPGKQLGGTGMALTAQAAEQQGVKRTIIILVVIGIHALGYIALQNGLARRLVELLPNDIQTKIIKEDKKEEPPPPPPPPPDQAIPPPPFVPPVEVAIAIPSEPSVNAITTTNEKPPITLPPVKAPPADVIIKPRADPKHPYGNIDEYYPSAAKRDGQEGVATIALVVGLDGKVSDVQVVTSSGFPLLDEAAIKFGKTMRLLPATKNGVPFVYSINLPIRFRIKNG